MTLQTRLDDFITEVGTDYKNLWSTLKGAAGAFTLNTTSQNVMGAINELKAAVDSAAQSGGASINDTTPGSSTTYSSTKINSVVSDSAAQVKTDILGAGVPAALNTLDELAAALGDDANFATTVTTGLGNRVRHDTAAQGLSTTQKQNARTNIDAYGSVEIGNPETDLVALYNAAKS